MQCGQCSLRNYNISLFLLYGNPALQNLGRKFGMGKVLEVMDIFWALLKIHFWSQNWNEWTKKKPNQTKCHCKQEVRKNTFKAHCFETVQRIVHGKEQQWPKRAWNKITCGGVSSPPSPNTLMNGEIISEQFWKLGNLDNFSILAHIFTDAKMTVCK